MRKNWQEWIKKNLGLTYTEYKRANAERKAAWYNAYQRGLKVS